METISEYAEKLLAQIEFLSSSEKLEVIDYMKNILDERNNRENI